MNIGKARARRVTIAFAKNADNEVSSAVKELLKEEALRQISKKGGARYEWKAGMLPLQGIDEIAAV